MDIDIRDEIERSFGDGPALPADDDLLRRAQGALRRRRLAETGTVVAVALIAVTGSLLLSGGDAPAEPGPAGAPATRGVVEPPHSGPAPRVRTPVLEDDRLPDDMLVDARLDGLHIAPGVEIRRVVDDPWKVRADGGWSVAVAYTAPGEPLTWWAGYVGADGGGSSASVAAEYARGIGFETWVAAQGDGVHSGTESSDPGTPPDGGWPGMTDAELVRFVDGAERLEPVQGVTLLRQRAHPDLPRSWAGPSDRSAVAEVELAGTRYYVLARSTPGDGAPQYIAVKAAQGGATLDDFLDFARDRYAEGGGGLL